MDVGSILQIKPAVPDHTATPRANREFFSLPAPDLAVRLLGCTIVRQQASAIHRARIVEVEAYTDDAASHAAARKRTPRNRLVFGPPGFAYIYLSYGVHHCLNVVGETDGVPGAVLIRGLDGIDRAAGPGLACRALGLSLDDNGRDLVVDQTLWIEPPTAFDADHKIITTTRIGISKAKELPWRFYLSGSTGVSKRDRAAEHLARGPR